jgi:hypothetical protein
MLNEQKISIQTRIRAKGFDISIGKRLDQIALISQSTDDFTSFASIRKGGRLAKIKRKFKGRLCSTTHFFFEGLSQDETIQLIKILK